VMLGVRRVCRFIERVQEKRIYHRRVKQAQQRILMFRRPYNLHIGCGDIKFNGWLNVDLNERLDTVDLIWDATESFPFQDQSCFLIYSEHFLEHLTIEQASSFLTECYRLLEPGGILRIAMPSLEEVIKKYSSEDWKNQDWLSWPEHQFIQTRAEMLNISFRWWGHKWLYDYEELSRRLHEAGFSDVCNVEWGKSDVVELRKRETRPDSLLICEGVK